VFSFLVQCLLQNNNNKNNNKSLFSNVDAVEAIVLKYHPSNHKQQPECTYVDTQEVLCRLYSSQSTEDFDGCRGRHRVINEPIVFYFFSFLFFFSNLVRSSDFVYFFFLKLF
jgi:hypothetical protein